MISDGGEELVAFARLQGAITALTAQRIEAGLKPATGYTGAALLLLITPRGGPRDPETSMRQRTYYLFSYAPTEAQAAQLDAVASGALHDRFIPGTSGRLVQTTEGQPGREPDTKWPYVMSIYQLRGL